MIPCYLLIFQQGAPEVAVDVEADFTRENFAPQPLGWPDEVPLCFVFLTFSLVIYVLESCPHNRMLEKKKSSQVFYLVLTVYFVLTMS